MNWTPLKQDQNILFKMKIWTLAHVFVNIILLIIYFYFFGQPSLRRFAKKGVIIIKDEEHTETIPPPGKPGCLIIELLDISYLDIYVYLDI